MDFDAFLDEDDMDVDVDLVESGNVGSRPTQVLVPPLLNERPAWARPALEPINPRKDSIGMIRIVLCFSLDFTQSAHK